jgi:peptidoglycan-associated lipoprotein
MIMNKKIWMGLALTMFLVACKSTPITETKVEDKSMNSTPAVTTTAPEDTSDANAVKEVTVDGDELNDPNSILAQRKIYFDFDSDVIKAEYRPAVEAHAKYLLAHSQAKVVLQGNADERGTREYNLSLGQRRSVSVKTALNLLGVGDAQIETVSYGEENATPNCANDSCFQQDRRVDVIYAK